MKKNSILLADNDPEFVKTRKEILEAEGYEVVVASNPEQAAEILLKESPVKLAIVDLRLRDDFDEADFSGLALIKNIAPHIPKILMTAYPTVEVIRRALKHEVDGIPAAVDIVAKQEGVEVLLRAVAQAMKNHTVVEKDAPPRKKITVMFIVSLVVTAGLMALLWDQGLKGVLVAVLAGIAIEIITTLVAKLTGLK